MARQWGDDFNIMSLVNDTMNALINENYEEELFTLIPQLIHSGTEVAEGIAEFNAIVHTIQNNAADTAVIERHKRLSMQLAPVMRLKKLASVSLINGMLLSDFYNENLYRQDALALLWTLITDGKQITPFSFEKYHYVASFNFYYCSLNHHLIQDIHRHGKEVKMWTLEGTKAPRMEVDGIITDRPDLWCK